MKEQPEFDQSELILVCMKDGKFLSEWNDGHATGIEWVTSPLGAKLFTTGTPLIHRPEYYQHHVPAGAEMVLLKINMTGWVKEVGPEQKPEDPYRGWP